ncbi:MAG: response regulator [Microcoleaceae cyanobacterium]
MVKNEINKVSILIIDDNPSNLKLLTNILFENDYAVRIYPSAKLGINSIMAESPDLILLDIKMPGMDGYTVCQQLKTNAKTCNIPVIFISALEDVMDKVKAFKMGGVDYIMKPFAPLEVIARIENQLQIMKKIK